jgi:N-acetylglucosaminyldiphosphoundecaprenol N-acetyl-beta-D-mannosaminyltransferase
LEKGHLNINGIKISDTGYAKLLTLINSSIESNTQTAIAYANANSVNLTYKFPELVRALDKFDIIHPDGIGIRIAGAILKNPFTSDERFTGSDFYPLLIEYAVKHKRSFYFFGHDEDTLAKIPAFYPQLKISGVRSGFDLSDEEVLSGIIENPADILVIGLGTPKQEIWTAANRYKLNNKVIICVGEGIKVFAGIKNRGPAFLRAIGLEWLWRFMTNPFMYFRRYFIGNPLFLYRIISIKMRKLAE